MQRPVRLVKADGAETQQLKHSIHLRVGLHKDENDMEVGVFGECLRTAPGVSLPRILISKLL